MIFSKFFQKKWQHKDSNVRVAAIDSELSVADSEQKNIILQLAQDDDSENVRRAALLKINDFDTWLQHSKTNSMAKIKKFAGKKVQAILLDQDEIKVSKQLKQQYITEHQASFFETWLAATEDSDLAIALFEKIAKKNNDNKSTGQFKPQLLIQLFNQKQQTDIQQYIIDQVDDIELLEKLKKKACHTDIANTIETKVSRLKAALEKPIQVEKQLNLVLAKLQALKDQPVYIEYIEKRQALLSQWQTLSADISCLTKEKQQQLNQKQTDICQNLDKLFAEKAEQHAQDEIVRQLEQEKQACRDKFANSILVTTQTLSDSIFANEQIDEEKYKLVFDKLSRDIQGSPLADDEKTRYLAQITEQQEKLSKLPEIAQSISDATQLISKVSQLTLPTNIAELNQRLPSYNEWLTSWKENKKQSVGCLPESINEAAQEIQKTWREAIKPLQAQQKQLFFQAKKKINDVNRLISIGKFNASFGVYYKAKQLFNDLSDNQQQRLQREFEQVTEKITELADWEHYIATPRKQQLLTEIRAIVEQPLDNPIEQAEKVKQFRKVWNSLGHADDDAEQALNEEFNQLTEQAFAPCRLYFSEQEKLRKQHFAAREAIIAKAQQLATRAQQLQESISDDKQNDYKTIERELKNLLKDWKNAGQVDRNIYKTVNENFTKALAPVKAVIEQYHQDNQLQKENLIKQSQALLNEEDIAVATEKVKSLQNKWKTIGFAGVKHDNKLWQNFREINDQIFAIRSEKSQQEKLALEQVKTAFQEKLTLLTDKMASAETIADHHHLEDDFNDLLNELQQQTPRFNGLEKNIQNALTKITDKIIAIKANNEKQQWHNLFTLLTESLEQQSALVEHSMYSTLSNDWKIRLQELDNLEQTVDRKEKTLEVEILAGLSSPACDQQQRMSVQVALMQKQMTSRAEADLNQYFVQWLMLGALTQHDLDLLQRVKPAFVK